MHRGIIDGEFITLEARCRGETSSSLPRSFKDGEKRIFVGGKTGCRYRRRKGYVPGFFPQLILKAYNNYRYRPFSYPKAPGAGLLRPPCRPLTLPRRPRPPRQHRPSSRPLQRDRRLLHPIPQEALVLRPRRVWQDSRYRSAKCGRL